MPAVETEAATTTEKIWGKLKTWFAEDNSRLCGLLRPTDADVQRHLAVD